MPSMLLGCSFSLGFSMDMTRYYMCQVCDHGEDDAASIARECSIILRISCYMYVGISSRLSYRIMCMNDT